MHSMNNTTQNGNTIQQINQHPPRPIDCVRFSAWAYFRVPPTPETAQMRASPASGFGGIMEGMSAQSPRAWETHEGVSGGVPEHWRSIGEFGAGICMFSCRGETRAETFDSLELDLGWIWQMYGGILFSLCVQGSELLRSWV